MLSTKQTLQQHLMNHRKMCLETIWRKRDEILLRELKTVRARPIVQQPRWIVSGTFGLSGVFASSHVVEDSCCTPFFVVIFVSGTCFCLLPTLAGQSVRTRKVEITARGNGASWTMLRTCACYCLVPHFHAIAKFAFLIFLIILSTLRLLVTAMTKKLENATKILAQLIVLLGKHLRRRF